MLVIDHRVNSTINLQNLIQKDCLDLSEFKKVVDSKKNIIEILINRNIKLTVKD